MLLQCIFDSLTSNFKEHLLGRKQEFMLPYNGDEVGDGPLLFRSISYYILPSEQFGNMALLEDLRKLRPVDLRNNIQDFHVQVDALWQQIHASPDGPSILSNKSLIAALFQVYNFIDVSQFRIFLEIQCNLAQTGSISSPHDLMRRADDKYNKLVGSGVWDRPSESQQILALQTKLKEANEKLRKAKKQKSSKEGDTHSTKTSYKTPDWKHNKPKDLTATCKHGNKIWNWGIHHEEWVVRDTQQGKHTLESCRPGKRNTQDKES